MEDFLLWDYIERDDRAYGWTKIKPRREGGTERALCRGYERVSKVIEAHMGMMANDDKRAAKNFKRLVKSHRKMPFFFQPVYRGSDNVQKELRFEEPEQKLSKKNFKEVTSKQNTIDPLGGYIDFMASSEGMYDGDRCYAFVYDEIFKIFKYNPNSQHAILKPTLELTGGMKIVGKAEYLSTVEEFSNGKSVEYAIEMWNSADPNIRDDNGRTVNGLYRYFRSALVLAPIDEWGFPKTEEFLEWYKNTEKSFLERKDYKGLAKWKRKYPMTVEEALQPPAEDCILHPALLEQRTAQIVAKKNWKGEPEKPRGIYGELVWEGGVKYGKVRWIAAGEGTPIDHKSARWCISQMPDRPNAGMNGTKPANSLIYSCGIDPIDTQATGTHQSGLSKVGITVKRKFDGTIDNEASGLEIFTHEDGSTEILNPEIMVTNRVVCDYVYRQDNPDDAFDDIVKTLFFFGCQGMLERNRVYARNKFRENSLDRWLVNEPLVLRSKWRAKNNSQDKGVVATTDTNEFSNEALIEYVYDHWRIIDHYRLLKCMRGFTGSAESRRKSDLTVSFGWTLTQDVDPRYKPEKNKQIFSFPFNPYKK